MRKLPCVHACGSYLACMPKLPCVHAEATLRACGSYNTFCPLGFSDYTMTFLSVSPSSYRENLLAMLVDDAHVSSTQAFLPARKTRVPSGEEGPGAFWRGRPACAQYTVLLVGKSNMCFIRQCSENLLAMLVDDAHVSSTQAFLPARKTRVPSGEEGPGAFWRGRPACAFRNQVSTHRCISTTCTCTNYLCS
jgi:hypothetical protein